MIKSDQVMVKNGMERASKMKKKVKHSMTESQQQMGEHTKL